MKQLKNKFFAMSVIGVSAIVSVLTFCSYSCSAVTSQEFINAVANVAKRGRSLPCPQSSDGGKYGNSVTVPPGNDCSSCDRLVDRALWDLGFKDIPIGVHPSNPSAVIISGAPVPQLGSYLKAHGWVEINSVEKIVPGAVIIMDTSPPYNGSLDHVTVAVSYTPHSGAMTVYDHGSTNAILQSVNGPWVRGFDDSQFVAGYIIDDEASDKALASIPSKYKNGYRIPYEGYPGRGWLAQPDYSYTGVKSGENPDNNDSKPKPRKKEPVAVKEECTTLLPQDWCSAKDGEGISSVVNLVLDIFSGGIIVTGTIGIIISGIMWMSAMDNAAQIAAAKRRIVNITIGIALFVLMDVLMGLILPK